MLFYDTPEFRVCHDEALRLLRLEWVGGPNLVRLRPNLVALQQLAQRLQATHVLLDLSRLPDLPVFDQIWLGAHWLPTTLPLPLQQVVLVLGSERSYNLQAIELLLEAMQGLIRFDVQFFSQPGPGLQWLVGDSPELPRLLANWQQAYQLLPAASDSFAEALPAYGSLHP